MDFTSFSTLMVILECPCHIILKRAIQSLSSTSNYYIINIHEQSILLILLVRCNNKINSQLVILILCPNLLLPSNPKSIIINRGVRKSTLYIMWLVSLISMEIDINHCCDSARAWTTQHSSFELPGLIGLVKNKIKCIHCAYTQYVIS